MLSCFDRAALELPDDAVFYVAASVQGGEVLSVSAGPPPATSPLLGEDTRWVVAAVQRADVELLAGFDSAGVGAATGEAAPADCARCLWPTDEPPWRVGPGESCRLPRFITLTVDGGALDDSTIADLFFRDVRVTTKGPCPPDPPRFRFTEPREIRAIWPPDDDSVALMGLSSTGHVLEVGAERVIYDSPSGRIELPSPGPAKDIIPFDDGSFLVAVHSADRSARWTAYRFANESLVRAAESPQIATIHFDLDEADGGSVRVLGEVLPARFAGGLTCRFVEDSLPCEELTDSASLNLNVSSYKASVEVGGGLLIAGVGNRAATKSVAVAYGRKGDPRSFVGTDISTVMISTSTDSLEITDGARVGTRVVLVGATEGNGFVALRDFAGESLEGDPSERARSLGAGWVTTSIPRRFCGSHFEVGQSVAFACGSKLLMVDPAGRIRLGSANELLASADELWRFRSRGRFRFAVTPGGTGYRSADGGAFEWASGPRAHLFGPIAVAAGGSGEVLGFSGAGGGRMFRTRTDTSSVVESALAGVPSVAMAAVITDRGPLVAGFEPIEGSRLVRFEDTHAVTLEQGGAPFVALSQAGIEVLLLRQSGALEVLAGDELVSAELVWDDPKTKEIETPTPCSGYAATFAQSARGTSPLRAIDAVGDFGFAVGCRDRIARLWRGPSGWRGRVFEARLDPSVSRPDSMTLSVVRAITPDLALVLGETSTRDEEPSAAWLVRFSDGPNGVEVIGTLETHNRPPHRLFARTSGAPRFAVGPLEELVVGAAAGWNSVVRVYGSERYWYDERDVHDAAYDSDSGATVIGTEYGGIFFVSPR